MKNRHCFILCCVLTAYIALIAGCSQQTNTLEKEELLNFGTEYNYQTDFQYSYESTSNYDMPFQSDGKGEYISKGGFIYYYDPTQKKLTPLCNKPNCLHDQETDLGRLSNCNAYSYLSFRNAIQYYDGYVYCVIENQNEMGELGMGTSLCRIERDGSKKDIIYHLDNGAEGWPWLIHRGYFYYFVKSFYEMGEGEKQQVCAKFTLKSVKLSSHMSTGKSNVIYESDENHSAISASRLVAYKDYLLFNIVANENAYDADETTVEDWYRQLFCPNYIYNTKTGESKIISVPSGYGNTVGIGNVAFLDDKLLVSLYDNLQSPDYPTRIYSMNYDLTQQEVWLDNVAQGKNMKTYDHYVVLTDGTLRFDQVEQENGFTSDVLKEEDNPHTNIEIYSADSRLIAHCVYPKSVRNLVGFGPDGVKLEIEDNDDGTWSLYRLNFEDVLQCQGETVQPELIGSREYGPLNKKMTW